LAVAAFLSLVLATRAEAQEQYRPVVGDVFAQRIRHAGFDRAAWERDPGVKRVFAFLDLYVATSRDLPTHRKLLNLAGDRPWDRSPTFSTRDLGRLLICRSAETAEAWPHGRYTRWRTETSG
jgi:hypothetical protein